jgi:phosphatidate cytidylyltransferase
VTGEVQGRISVRAGPVLKRILSAVVFLPAFWLIVKEFGRGPYEALVILAGALALWEMYALAQARGLRPHRLLGAGIALAVLASFALPWLPLPLVLACALFLVPVATLQRGGAWERAFPDIGATLFSALFIGLSFGYLMALRRFDDLPKGDETGSDLVFLLFFIVWTSDVAAYCVGHAIGRRPLAPRVSPRKTIEGAVGGVLGALAAAFIARLWFIYRLGVRDAVVLGLALGGIGILGDLVESMLKRGADVKDSAALVPGHGGLLDRVDSLLYAAPLLYYYYLFAMRA